MAQPEDRTCFNCFWEWEDEGLSRCTRLPPLPIFQSIVGEDVTRMNKTTYAPCPGSPACGEWQPLDMNDTVIIEEIEEVLGEQRKT